MRILKLISLVGLGLAFSATANAQFSVSGAGSPIPGSGSGGGGTWDTVMPPTPSDSAVAVPVAVTNIDSIVIDGLTHTWAGDVQATLADPNGVEHLLFVRPGYLNTSGAGTAGDFLLGTYTFVESGGGSLPTASDGVDITPGTYNQTFDTGGVVWVSGASGIFNTPLSSISGPAGNWSLKVYDWAAGDSGSFTSWTLNGNGGGATNAYCFGDGTGTACPCASGGAGEGCANSTGSGAALSGSGTADTAADTFVLDAAGLPATTTCLFFQGTNIMNGGNGNPFGDGLRCIAGNVVRLQTVTSDGSGNAATTISLSVRGNIAPSTSMDYQMWYRDTASTCGSVFNTSNAWLQDWN